MFSTGTWSVIYAHNAVTGELLWEYDPQVPREWAIHACCDVVNRGVAVWEGNVYSGTLDGRLVAIDAASGKKVWETLTIDRSKSYTITGAPRVVNGKIIIGNGGAEYGVRGYVSAYDAKTGEMDWRFYTVPGNPADGFENEAMRKAAETWPGDGWWEHGPGGTVWDSMAYDPELNLLYVGVGNGAPWNRYLRAEERGDMLYLSSIVALNPDTGEYVWHYQETPFDGWDYTATQHMILADLEWKGEMRKVLMQAPKNGFFFIIDRVTGEFLSAEAYSTVNWALGYDENGRPIENPEVDYKTDPKLIIPSSMGAHNWHPMAYNPNTGLVYIPKIVSPMNFTPIAPENYERRGAGRWNLGFDLSETPPGDPLFGDMLTRAVTRGELQAWDPKQQKQVWSVPHPMTWNGGVLTTEGNLVFQGTSDGRFVAYRADNGKHLWEFPTQSGILAAPITFSVDGEQYVTVLVGYGGAFGLISGLKPKELPDRSRIMTFKLGGKETLPPTKPPVIFEPPPQPEVSEDVMARGKALYYDYCVACHGVNVISNGAVPDLRYMAPVKHELFHKIVLDGIFSGAGMVGFAPDLNEQDADAIQAYILLEAHKAKDLREQPEWLISFKTWLYGYITRFIAWLMSFAF